MGRRVTVGVSLKMYFGHAQTLDYASAVADIARRSDAVQAGDVELFVLPSFPALAPALDRVDATRVRLGAQDLHQEDRGAFTGEVSGAELAEMGVELAAVGHAERRRLFGETDDIVRAKTAAALRSGLVPVLCVGETDSVSVDKAVAAVTAQLDSALDGAPAGRVIVAYEPVWAIGAAEPASADHIRGVCSALRELVAGWGGHPDSSVIYGGSAGPGLLSLLGETTDGIFLGRFAHDPAALEDVVNEAAALAKASA